MMKNTTKSKFYSLDPILATNSTYNMIIGERSNGKTYACLKYGLFNFLQGNGQTAYLRRWQEDITGSRGSEVFSSLVANGEIEKLSNGEYSGIYYYSRRYYLCNYDDNGKPIYNEDDLFCYSFALSDVEHNKSVSYPKITTIVFDEFLTRDTYLRDEFIKFMNTVSTIVRQRTNVKIFMLGNTVNRFSPYFNEMGLNNITGQEQGTIDIYSYGKSKLKVAVEYCAESKHKKENNFYFAFNNPKLKMITSGAWELDLYPHCPVKFNSNDIQLIYFIIFNGKIYQAEIVEKDGAMFTYIHNKTTPIKNTDEDIIFSLEHNPKPNYSRSIIRPNSFLKINSIIREFFENDKVFYQDNEVGDAINNYINECKKL